MEGKEKDMDGMYLARLKSIRGFLFYVSSTYQYMNPYLKGLNITFDSWRPHRDEEGYKF